ncbi:unnamed protein product [Dimorphilus gyrociliatus]|uniref:Uncharacterized protein n=1 Tax=Dimorphilus gyrociliatus TaxID=2664684 RepID=A0A7I8W057_9ANNE|nr:unnamed protein product [Dimorphilus gyrociliatus]
MVIRVDEIMEILQTVAKEQNMKVTIKEGLKGAVLAGTGAFGGAMLGGPPGIIIGSALGGALGYFMSKSFKPVYEIINDLPANERKILYNRTMNILTSFEVRDVAGVIALVQGNPELLKQLVQMLEHYLTQDKEYKI